MMTALGKIFIYENNINKMRHYVNDLEAQGFFAFGTDNLYKLLRYSEEVNPDIVIMNLPKNFDADPETWQQIEQSLCKKKCPQVYINSTQSFKNKPDFHYIDFKSEIINKEQILNIIQNPDMRNYLH